MTRLNDCQARQIERTRTWKDQGLTAQRERAPSPRKKIKKCDGRRATGDGRRATGDGRRMTGDARRATGDARRATGDGKWHVWNWQMAELGHRKKLEASHERRRTTGDGRRATADMEFHILAMDFVIYDGLSIVSQDMINRTASWNRPQFIHLLFIFLPHSRTSSANCCSLRPTRTWSSAAATGPRAWCGWAWWWAPTSCAPW